MARAKQSTIFRFSEHDIRVWQIDHPGSRGTVSLYKAQRIDDQSSEKIEQLLSSWINPKELSSQTHRVILAVARKQILFRYLTLPTHDANEVSGMVALQLESMIPYQLDDVVFHSFVVDQKKDGYAKVLVACISKELIRQQLKILHDVGVYPQFVTVDVFGFTPWLASINQTTKDSQTDFIIHADGVGIDFVIQYGGHPVFARTLRTGINDVQDWKYVFDQIEMTIASFKEESIGGSVSRFVLIGQPADCEPLHEHLDNHYEASISIVEPLEGSKYRWPMTVTEQKLWPTAGMGLALTSNERMVNFLPQDIQQQSFKIKHIKTLLMTLAIVLVALIMAFSVLYSKSFQKNKELSDVQSQVKIYKKSIDGMSLKEEEMKMLEQRLAGRVLLADVMKSIQQIIPESLTLTLVDWSERGNFILQGYSEQESDVNRLQKGLVRADMLNKVSLDFVNQRKTKSGNRVYFKISAELK